MACAVLDKHTNSEQRHGTHECEDAMKFLLSPEENTFWRHSIPARRRNGFTLIEMMVTLVVIAILAAIATPFYQDFVRRSEVTEATNTLSNWRVQMEQYYQDNKSYSSAPGGGGNCGVPAPAAPAVTYFTYACALGTTGGVGVDQSYTMTARGAVPLTNGFVYTLNEANLQATPATGVWARNSANSWITRK